MDELRKPELPETRRGQLEVQADILRVAMEKGGARKTHIVYGANLNFRIVNAYLERMISGGFLELEGKRYFPTEKARTYLETFDSLQSY